MAIGAGRPVFWGNPLGFDAYIAGWAASTPTQMPGGLYAMREVGLYNGTICGIRSDDLVFCWGTVPGASDGSQPEALYVPVGIPLQ